jgi:hypothetical protein
MSKKKKIIDKLIPFNVASISLLVDSRQLEIWANEGKFSISYNENNKPCIRQSDLKRIAHSEIARKASKEEIKLQTYLLAEEEKSGNNKFYLSSIVTLIKNYKKYIKDLEDLHYSYHKNVNIIENESALVAAYILYSKVISLLYMCCYCLEKHFFHSGIFFRLIDETIDLAHYFIVTEKSEKGKKHIKEWFREDNSPRHEICREELAKHTSSILKVTKKEAQKELYNELYHIKSKIIHPTLKSIMEVIPFKIKHDELFFKGFDYQTCSFPRKMLEITEFFQSSIWTAFQGFYFCFHEKMPLTEKDKDFILTYDKNFNKSRANRIVL